MKFRAVMLMFVLGGCAPSVPTPGLGPAFKPTSTGFQDLPLCGLESYAEEKDLWGAMVRISGIHSTDQQTYDFVIGNCGANEGGALEFDRLETMRAPGLERMAEAVKNYCGRKVFCAFEAKVVVVGRLIKDEEAAYGMLLDVVEIQSYEIIDRK